MLGAMQAHACLTEEETIVLEDWAKGRSIASTARIAELETEVKLRDANTYTLGEINKVRNYVDSRFERVECQLNQQAVYNATNTAALNCMQGQIAQLMSLTKMVVPNGSICPGWGDVTVSITPTTTT